MFTPSYTTTHTSVQPAGALKMSFFSTSHQPASLFPQKKNFPFLAVSRSRTAILKEEERRRKRWLHVPAVSIGSGRWCVCASRFVTRPGGEWHVHYKWHAMSKFPRKVDIRLNASTTHVCSTRVHCSRADFKTKILRRISNTFASVSLFSYFLSFILPPLTSLSYYLPWIFFSHITSLGSLFIFSRLFAFPAVSLSCSCCRCVGAYCASIFYGRVVSKVNKGREMSWRGKGWRRRMSCIMLLQCRHLWLSVLTVISAGTDTWWVRMSTYFCACLCEWFTNRFFTFSQIYVLQMSSVVLPVTSLFSLSSVWGFTRDTSLSVIFTCIVFKFRGIPKPCFLDIYLLVCLNLVTLVGCTQ